MTFATTLDEYCKSLGCTNKELAEHCGLSASSISRYRSGERAPDYRSESVGKLSQAIALLFEERNVSPQQHPTAQEIKSSFEQDLSREHLRGLLLCTRLDQLLTTLDIRNSELAARLEIDPSYLSRIRNRKRIPADQQQFIKKCARLIATRCIRDGKVEHLASTIEIPGLHEAIADGTAITRAQLAKFLRLWLSAAI